MNKKTEKLNQYSNYTMNLEIYIEPDNSFIC